MHHEAKERTFHICHIKKVAWNVVCPTWLLVANKWPNKCNIHRQELVIKWYILCTVLSTELHPSWNCWTCTGWSDGNWFAYSLWNTSMTAFYLLCHQCFESLQGFPTREVKMEYCNCFVIFVGNTASQHTGCLHGGAGASWAQETVWCCPPASLAAFGKNSPLHHMPASSTPKYECVNLLK